MADLSAHCPSCGRDFAVIDDPSLDASYRCPVCLTPGIRTQDQPAYRG